LRPVVTARQQMIYEYVINNRDLKVPPCYICNKYAIVETLKEQLFKKGYETKSRWRCILKKPFRLRVPR
jgi:hypothetical protein